MHVPDVDQSMSSCLEQPKVHQLHSFLTKRVSFNTKNKNKKYEIKNIDVMRVLIASKLDAFRLD